MLQRLKWRRVLLVGVVVAAGFTLFAILTQSAFWFLVGGAVLMLTGMLLFVIGAQTPQPQAKKRRKGRSR